MWTVNFQMFKLDLEKAEEPEIKLPTFAGSLRSKRVPEKYLLMFYWLCQSLWLCGSQQTVKNSERTGVSDHLTCFLRNLSASQEATVRMAHGKTDWLQTGKRVHPGCIFSPCLFNIYAEYNMRTARLDEEQLDSRLPGEISITSDTQMSPPLW